MREPAGYLKQSPGIGRLDTLFNKRDYAAAERCWSDRHVQHSAHIAPSRDGLFISRPLATRHTALREPTHRGGRRLRNRAWPLLRQWPPRCLDRGRHCPHREWQVVRAFGRTPRRGDQAPIRQRAADVRVWSSAKKNRPSVDLRPRQISTLLVRFGETAAFEYCPGGAQVRCLEALREPIVYRGENLPRMIMPVLPYP